MAKKTDGSMDQDYVNSFGKPPRWLTKKVQIKMASIKTQTELQELLVGVTTIPNSLNQNNTMTNSTWYPTFVPETVLNEIIDESSFSNDHVAMLKEGYKSFFNTLGKDNLRG